MLYNALPATEFFRVPPDRVIKMGGLRMQRPEVERYDVLQPLDDIGGVHPCLSIRAKRSQ
jgi:hypothetical protein